MKQVINISENNKINIIVDWRLKDDVNHFVAQYHNQTICKCE